MGILGDILGLIHESIMLTKQNKNITFLIIFINMIISSIFYLLNLFASKNLIDNFLTANQNIFEDINLFMVEIWGFLVIFLVATFPITISSIIVFAAKYDGGGLNVDILVTKAIKSWKDALLTIFYVSFLKVGYIFVTFYLVLPMVLFASNSLTLRVLEIAVFILAEVLLCYLSVTWDLSIIVSVIEEKRGIEALGKSGYIVNEMKLRGFYLNVMFAVSGFLVYGIKFIIDMRTTRLNIASGLVMVNLIAFIRVFYLVVYIVFYYRCKKIHEEDVNLLRIGDYENVPNASLNIENIV